MPALAPAPVPAIWGRPEFPAGLKVLVVENEFVLPAERLAESMSLLKEASYDAESLPCSEAVARLQNDESRQFDVLLVSDEDFNCGAHCSLFRTLAASHPVLLLSESFETKTLLSGIEGGAIHSLRLPLDRRQVQKVWQQCVRKHVMGLRSEAVSERMRSRSDTSAAAAASQRNDTAAGPAPSRKRELNMAEEVTRRPVRLRTAKGAAYSRWGSGVMAPRASASQAAATAPALPAMAPPVALSARDETPLVGGGSSSVDLPWALLGDSTDALLSLLPPSASACHGRGGDRGGGGDHHRHDGAPLPLLSSAEDALDALLPCWDGAFLGSASFASHLCADSPAAAAAPKAAGSPPVVFLPPPRESTPSLASTSPSTANYSVEGFSLFSGDSADSLRAAHGPLGLRLRKSPSLASLVQESLSRGCQPSLAESLLQTQAASFAFTA